MVFFFNKYNKKVIDEIYLMVFPFFQMDDSNQIARFQKIWKNSLYQTSRNENAFLFYFFNGYSDAFDRPQRLIFHYGKPSVLEFELAQYSKELFSKNRVYFEKVNNFKDYQEKRIHTKVLSRIENPKALKITGRGLYGDHCVTNAVNKYADIFKVSKNNAHVVYEESLFMNQYNAEKYNCLDNVIINNKGRFSFLIP